MTLVKIHWQFLFNKFLCSVWTQILCHSFCNKYSLPNKHCSWELGFIPNYAFVVNRETIRNQNHKPNQLWLEQTGPVSSTVFHFVFSQNYWKKQNFLFHLSLVTRKPVFGVFDQATLKPACSASETSQGLEISAIASRGIILFRQRTTKALIRLRGRAGWSAPLLFA